MLKADADVWFDGVEGDVEVMFLGHNMTGVEAHICSAFQGL